MVEPVRYVLDPIDPFPKRWLDKDGSPIRVMCEPVEGYVLARRPGCIPFAIGVRELLNVEHFQHHLGPFTVVPPKPKREQGAQDQGRATP